MLDLEAAFQLYSLLADGNVVRIAKSLVADVGDQARLHMAPIVVQWAVPLASVLTELAMEFARVLPALALVQAVLVGSSSLKCEMKLHLEELELIVDGLSVRQGMDPSLWLELDSAVAEIVEKQNQLFEWVAEVARLQKENSTAAENSLLRRSTRDRTLRHWDLAMIVLIAGSAFLVEQSEHPLAAGLEQVVLLVAE